MRAAVDTTKRRWLSPRAPGLLPALSIVLALVIAAPTARAESVHLPLSGLLVELPGEGWQVASRWSAVDPIDPTAGASGEDALTDAAGTTYRVQAGGRTERPCPLDNPFVIELDQREWIHDPASNTLCHLQNDARLEVRIDAPTTDLGPHAAVLDALAEAFVNRTVAPDAKPPLFDARVTSPDTALPDLTMPTIGLTPKRPNDGYLWRVARARAGRHFDALVRVFPTFPEVQLLIYRHDRRDVPSCDALAQRQVARGPWRVSKDDPPQVVRSLGRFTIVDHCATLDDALIETRAASAPRVGRELEPMLWSLVRAAQTDPLPELPATIPARDFLWRWATAGGGLIWPESRDALPFGEAEIGVAYARRNGVFLRGVARLGASSEGALGGGSVDLGVALGVDPELTLVLALGIREDVDPVLENRSFTGTLELYSGFNRDRSFAWALRFIPFHVASRQPAVGGAPLVIAFDGLFDSGLLVGLDLKWVDRPFEPQPGWVGSGVTVGVRVGFGSILR